MDRPPHVESLPKQDEFFERHELPHPVRHRVVEDADWVIEGLSDEEGDDFLAALAE